MRPFNISKRIAARFVTGLTRLSLAIKLLPKRYLSRSAVKYIGPSILKQRGSSSLVVREKPHILILRNKFYSKKSGQISTEEFHLDNTLSASNLATFDVLTYDHDLLICPLSDLQLIAKCRNIQPDAIVLSSWRKAPHHPSIASLKFIRETLGIPIAALWWDTCSDSFWHSIQPFIAEFEVHAIMDNPELYYINKKNELFNRVIPLWTPQDEGLFSKNVSRDIPVSFIGQASSYRSYRNRLIDYLIEHQVDGYFSMNRRDKQVSHEEYARLISSSKMSINFSYSVSCDQLKGRVFDIMLGGAMLLESENKQISKLFVPMKDYVPFNSKEDLLNKIQYYLDNDNELIEIAERGRSTVIKNYNAYQFWRLLLGKLELI